MKTQKVKTIVAKLLKTGKSKIWIDPNQREKISEAMTKEDVRSLIADKIAKRKKTSQQNKKRVLAKKKGRKRGPGKRKGTAKARTNPKKKWIKSVRAQRKKLRQLKAGKLKISYQKAYKMIKGGYFRGKKHLELTVVGVKKWVTFQLMLRLLEEE